MLIPPPAEPGEGQSAVRNLLNSTVIPTTG